MTEWWQEMFASPAWQGVQLSWDSLETEGSPAQTDLLERALRLEPGMRILDAPCGTGRIALELADRGYAVTGIDITDRFLEDGRGQAAARGIEVDLRHADLREPLLEGGTFDAAVCFWGSFGYFDDAGNLAQARAAAEALRPGGRYLIDTPCLETVLPRFRDRHWFEVDDTVVLQETEWSAGTGRVETTWTFLRGSERAAHRSSIRLYSLHELTELLRAAGFTAFEARDDDLEPFELGAHRLWLVATR
jgi:SAM-dependent methyltransferase